MRFKHLKLYHYPATRSARVKWALHETAGDDFEVERVDLFGRAQYRAEFMTINPNHNVPVLEITWASGDVQYMLESAAIVTFLADFFPQRQLAPAPHLPARADYLQMMHFGSTWMDMMLWQIRVHETLLPATERDSRTAGRYREKFRDEVEPQLTARLRETSHICGNVFTAADCVIGHNVRWARHYGMCGDEVFGRYMDTLAARPAYVAAFADAHELRH